MAGDCRAIAPASRRGSGWWRARRRGGGGGPYDGRMDAAPSPVPSPGREGPVSGAEQQPPAGLAEAAWQAQRRARAPYSRFRVGAALLTRGGTVVGGCNVENGSYGLTMCAERVALFSAIAAGHDGVIEMALVSDHPGPITPCGACRQVMAELAPGARLWMGSPDGRWRQTSVEALLPDAFHFDRAPV